MFIHYLECVDIQCKHAITRHTDSHKWYTKHVMTIDKETKTGNRYRKQADLFLIGEMRVYVTNEAYIYV